MYFSQDLNSGKRSLGEPLYILADDRKEIVRDIRLKALLVQQEYRPLFSKVSLLLWNVLKQSSQNEYER